jgi:hypothetical protein
LAEHTLDCLSTDEDEQDLWVTLVDFWAGTPQDVEQEADIVTATDHIQSATAGPTTATTETEPMQASTSDSTRAQAENIPTDRTDTDEELQSCTDGQRQPMRSVRRSR